MLTQPKNFYDVIRRMKLFGPKFETHEFEGCEEILKDCAKAKWPVAYTAYALATAYHETAGTMQPIKEYGGFDYYMKLYDISGKNPARAKEHGNVNVGDGAKYCGRGYVQLTWKVNYIKAGRELGYDLVNHPDLALNKDVASDIMIRGMERGWFTKYKLIDCLPTKSPATRAQFREARRIINGTDKADLIADYAEDFQEALISGRWT